MALDATEVHDYLPRPFVARMRYEYSKDFSDFSPAHMEVFLGGGGGGVPQKPKP